MVISTPAAELAPGHVVRFSDGTPAENGDLTVAAVETRHGPFWDWVRVTWTEGGDSDWRAWETLDVVAPAAPARGLKPGDLVTLDGRRYVVESVTPDGSEFSDTYGASHKAARAEIVPLAAATAKAA